MVPGRDGRPKFEGRGGKMTAAPATRPGSSRTGGRWNCGCPWTAEREFVMNHLRWVGKRRRSTLGSDSFCGSSSDSIDSPLLPSGPVLSPPAGLGRSLKDRGHRPAAAAGTLRQHSVGNGRGGQLSRTLWREVPLLVCTTYSASSLFGLWFGPGVVGHFVFKHGRTFNLYSTTAWW